MSPPPVFHSNNAMSMDICTAIKRGYFALVRFLVDLGADVNHKDDNGKTPLILCSMMEDRQWADSIAQTLLENSASVGLRDRYGMTALHYACLNECVSLVALYLRALDFDLNIGDKHGHSALFYAVLSGNTDCVRKMVDAMTKYCVPVDRANKFGTTPLMQAYKTKRFDLAHILVHEGCADEELRDNEGKTAREIGEHYRRIYEVEQRLGARRARIPRPNVSIRRSMELDEKAQKTLILPLNKSSHGRLRLCKDCDLRNDPLYMFNLSPLDCFTVPIQTEAKGTKHRRPMTAAGANWRQELRYLYKHLEVKHTPSFRETITIPRPATTSEGAVDFGDSHRLGLRIPGTTERRGSGITTKASLAASRMRQVERLVANPLVKGRRGSNQSPTGRFDKGKQPRDTDLDTRRSASRQAPHTTIPVVKEPS